jgi:DNA-binding transcriptional MerR regulator
MEESRSDPVVLTYPLRAAARVTGLAPELLRAWERRYGAVAPARTPGGTRRYSVSDLERLRLLKAAVDAGHRIGRVARLGIAELRACVASPEAEPKRRGLEEILDGLDRLDGEESRRLLSIQLAALGPIPFAREVALPLLREIGERWAAEQIGIASEHLGSNVLRAMLGSALQPSAASNPLYLGAELPVEDLLGAVERTDAAALALSVVTLPTDAANRTLRALRRGLPDGVPLWVGGCGASRTAPVPGVEKMESLEELERRVELLGFERDGSW